MTDKIKNKCYVGIRGVYTTIGSFNGVFMKHILAKMAQNIAIDGQKSITSAPAETNRQEIMCMNSATM